MNNAIPLPPWWLFVPIIGVYFLMKLKNRTETAPVDPSDTETTPFNADTSDPSSSSSDVGVSGYDYEVFLSFRGPDTRKKFTNHLYISLKEAGINVFLDDENLHVGEEIGGKLLEAINQSKIFIPIFSEDYASSKWCLMEVAHVVKSMNESKQLVLPIFDDVTPDDVKHQSGTYKKAFKAHSNLHNPEKVQEWRDSLRKIGGIKGWEVQKIANGNRGELVKLVVSKVWRELKKAFLVVSDSLVGMEDSVEDVMELLHVGSNDVRMVGIYGIGGIGKTTLAKIIYNQLLEHFDYSSFLKDVREMSSKKKGLEKLQTQLVRDILKSENLQRDFVNVDDGIGVLSQRFRNKKVLILLDDVDKGDQIKALAFDLNWFAGGSRIIVTTRKKDVLDLSKVTRTYEVRPMPSDKALLLFCKHAFRRDSPDPGYADLSGEIVATTGGLPLALEVIGSLLSVRRKRELWKETCEKLQKVLNDDVKVKLRISYDALCREQQHVFLDIACFFIGTDKRIASYMWSDCDFFPEDAIEVLVAMSLIKVGDDNVFWMHDQLRDLGRGIVRQENDRRPGERSRLWSTEDAMNVFRYGQGTENIEAINLDFGIGLMNCCLRSEHFAKLTNLRFLGLAKGNIARDFQCRLPRLKWLQWHCCPVELTVTTLYLENLVILDLSKSNITDCWSGWNSRQLAIRLKVLILESCQNLTKTPDFSRFQSLERLSLEDCENLYLVDPSIGKLKNLIFLSLKDCSKLRVLPQELTNLEELVELHIDGSGVQELPNLKGLKKLEILSAKKCKSLSEIPQSLGHLTSLVELSLDKSGVCALPESTGGLTSLEKLCLSETSLHTLPDSIRKLSNLQELLVSRTTIINIPSSPGMLEKLKIVDASYCRNLKGDIFTEIGRLCSLTTLRLCRTEIARLPGSISRFSHLEELDLTACDELQALPELPSSLRSLSVTCRSMTAIPNLSNLVNLEELALLRCHNLKEVPQDIGNLSKLKELRITETRISKLPEEIGTLSRLRRLVIENCAELEHMPNLPAGLRELKVKGISAQTFPDLSSSTKLLKLEISSCSKLKKVPGLGSLKFLNFLTVSRCDELAELEGFERLESLTELNIALCGSLERLSDLSLIKHLEKFIVHFCESLLSLPDLSALKSLRYLSLVECDKLHVLEGVGELESLEHLNISGCKDIENLPNLSKLRKLEELLMADCEKLKELQGLDELKSLKRVHIYCSPSLHQYVKKWPDIPWDRLPSSTDGIVGQLGSRSHSSPAIADPTGYDYDVFLSFRGLDTRKGFVDYLYTSLALAGIRAFRDDEVLPVGEDMGGNLLEAITQSKISIIIFSKNYASSKWCLREVAHMVKYRNKLILPIFYDVTPHEVRHQSGTYEVAFRLHSERHDKKTVQEWRNALADIGSLRGWELQNVADGREGELVKLVVAHVCEELKRIHRNIVGVTDRVEEVMKLLQVGSGDVKMVGIYGMGGIGKTTLAEIIYDQLLEHFEYCSFLKNIHDTSMRHKGIEKLQNQLVSDILKPVDSESEFGSGDEGIKVLSQRFRNKKVLILLDDVCQSDQINALAADLNWFAGGSRIIVTTREKEVLNVSQVTGTYEVRAMRSDEALALFSWHASKTSSPLYGFEDVSQQIVSLVGGLPLALEVVGSFLSKRGWKQWDTTIDIKEWETTIEILEKVPRNDVQNMLKISYDGLNFEQKQLFLDIACFFNGTDKRIATRSGFFSENGIEALRAMSLIKIGHDNEIWMHDLLKELGRNLVREENTRELGTRSRLWLSEEARDALGRQEGIEKIEAMDLDYGYGSGDHRFEGDRLKNLSKLRYLRLCNVDMAGDFDNLLPQLSWLHWHYCPERLQATNLCLQNLVILNLSESRITDDWNGWSSLQTASKLKVLILQSCQRLTKTPEFSGFPALERLNLENCRKLQLVDSSIVHLKNLLFLSLKNCSGLRELPRELSCLEALVELHLDGSGIQELPTLEGLRNLKMLSAKQCISLSHIPPSIGHLTSLSELSLDQSGVCSLPGSIGALVKLELLSLRECKSITELPHSIEHLSSLKVLCLSKTSIHTLPDSIGMLDNLQALLVDETKITDLPSAVRKLWKLKVIDASLCKSLKGEIFPELGSFGFFDGRLDFLTTLKLGRTNITMLPADMRPLRRLETLDLTNCNALQALPRLLPTSLRSLSVTCRPMATLPEQIGDLDDLERLFIGNCTKLQHIPKLPANLKELKVTGISAQKFPDFSNSAKLKTLSVSWCHELVELDGLEKLEYLTELNIEGCGSLETISGLSMLRQLERFRMHLCTSLQSLPDLSSLKGLIYLSLSGCKKLCFLEGLGEVVQLEYLNMSGCIEIESLPNLSKLGKLREVILDECEKLRELRGLEELKSLQIVSRHRCPSLFQYVKKWPNVPWQLPFK